MFQATGFATFDGLSSASFTLTENTTLVTATPLNWSGAFSVPANCAATVTVSTGGSATLNVLIYNQGKTFTITGSDATYSYSGSGVAQPTGCSASTLSGVYTFNATGFAIASNGVSGAENAIGLLQFDGQGNLTASLSTAPAGQSSPLSLTGTYTLSSNCVGTATLTDASSHSYGMNFSLYSIAAANTNFYATIARAGNLVVAGAGHTAYSSPGSGTCSTSTLNGTYSLSLSGRDIGQSGTFAGSLQGIGTATFDGNGNLTLTGTENSNTAQGQALSYTGTYTLPSNCSGMLSANGVQGPLLVWNNGGSIAIIGQSGAYVLSGTGSNTAPPACAAATLSGEYIFSASGFTETGNIPTGAQEEAGVLQFDGQGNIRASFTDTQGGATPVSASSSGTYAVKSNCTASATLKDASGNAESMNFVISGAHGETLDVLAADSQFERLGSAHAAFGNPSQAIGNVASYAYSATPPGSVFTIFGSQLATRPGGAVTTKLPTELLTTSVTVNGQTVPLFYVDSGQIDAQMPWNIPGNTVASVVVTNGTSTSNTAAIYVPATGTPGISTYGNNRAVVINVDGSVNSGSDEAKVGDEVVVYFTGGGPVQASGTLTSGSPDPGGLSPITAPLSITVGGEAATIDYIGLTPGSIGLYQANFVVPQLAKGSYPVVITISGYASNAPVMSVSN